MKNLRSLIAMALLGLAVFLLLGCDPDAVLGPGPTLVVAPSYILPGQSVGFVFTFTRSIPWLEIPDAAGYLVQFEIGGNDIMRINDSYDGTKRTDAVLRASPDALLGRRKVKISAQYQPAGGAPLSHSEFGYLDVLSAAPVDEVPTTQDDAGDGFNESRDGSD